MKKITILLFVFMIGISLAAQDKGDDKEYKSLFGSDKITHGGYAGLVFRYSKINNEDGILLGARGGWIINHGISIGLGGYGFVNNINYMGADESGMPYEYELTGGYAGLVIEPIIGAKWPVHIAVPILIGGGGVSDNDWDDSWDPGPFDGNSEGFFVVEPGIEIELNMVKFLRLAIGGYYRFTTDVNLISVESNVMNGFSGGITLKFGKF